MERITELFVNFVTYLLILIIACIVVNIVNIILPVETIVLLLGFSSANELASSIIIYATVIYSVRVIKR